MNCPFATNTCSISREIERLRRSAAMAAPGAPGGLTLETALAMLTELQEVIAHRDKLIAGLVALGYA